MKPLYSNCLAIIFFVTTILKSLGQAQTVQLPALKVNPFKSGTSQTGIVTTAPYTSNQVPGTGGKNLKIEIEKGSFHLNLKKYKLTKEQVSNNFKSWLRLSDKYSFQQISERTDDLGFTHINYQQLFNGITVDGALVMVHFKNGEATSINGQIAETENIKTQQTISATKALELAKRYLKATELITEYPVELLIAGIPTKKGKVYKLVYKVRIDIAQPLTMYNVFVDAATGKVLNKIDLIAHADTPGTATTLYSGTQSITCDSYNGSYRLRESGRNIQTYNATNASNALNYIPVTSATVSGYVNSLTSQSLDYTNGSSNWTSSTPKLSSFTISSVGSSWWYAPFADAVPDLYFIIKDAFNQVIFNGRSSYISDMDPPLTFNNLSVFMVNPPYTIEIWDYDAVGSDDFGGSYTLNTSSGVHSLSGNGNTGSYTISSSNNPALDVHWGMEKTYDFYSSVFNRNSFDDLGSAIKNFVFPPGLTNNASALPTPYNVMQYGTGDGIGMGPVVNLDVEGHEFTHMVVNHNGNGGLTYQGESGALNESFADIFGTCIEFHSGVSPDWLIGENIMLQSPFMRSMSNPNSGQQPDTYNSPSQNGYWADPSNSAYDNGGVHVNSGVQNYWFYLLCQGGSGTNDLGNSYSVTGIGINQARQIAYLNLTTYLGGSNSTYYNSYYGSLDAAEQLYGNPSTQYDAVRAAWYAVGIGSNPYTYCSGQTWLTASSGTVTDGSGNANYNDNSNCKWVIAPPGANQITITFTVCSLEVGFDTIFIYGGTDTIGPPSITLTGTTLPQQITTQPGLGAVLVKFKTDNSVTAQGWSFNYTSTGVTPTCGGGTILSSPTGTFNDGSGSGNYANNQVCVWYIAPPCATSVTLDFSSFNTELSHDGIIVFDDLNQSNMILNTSGTTIPGSVTSNTGTMLVYFVSNSYQTFPGFSANYTSTGAAYCTGTANLNTSDYGIITDGSGGNNYCNNMNCQWLIQPPQATTVSLNFTTFDVEPASPDGQSIPDAVEVYNGTTTAAPLLGRFSGNNLPPSVTSTGGSMLVRFYSDLETTAQGWSANYTSTSNPYCNAQTTLTAPSGNFSDGSGANQYANNTSCSWLIQPPNASTITFSFVSLSTEQNNDGVIVYDGANNTDFILGQFSGINIPSSVTSTGGSMLVEFLSGVSVRGVGWTANYTSTQNPLAPVASFVANNTNVCTGTCINFTDNSTNSPTTWNWSFPGSNTPTSTAQNPSNICYPTAGIYSVSLTASNSGGSNSVTMSGYITVNAQPSVSIIPSGPGFCVGSTVTLSTNPTGSAYTWSGPNSFNSSLSSVAVAVAGNYSVTVTNPANCVGTASANTTVSQYPSPTANAGTDQTNTGAGVTIGGSPTASSGTAPYSYQWNPTNSLNNATVSNPTANPSTATTYSVTVADNNNCTATDNVLVNVSCLSYTLSNATQYTTSSGGNFSVNIYTDQSCPWSVNTGACSFINFNTSSGSGSANIPFSVDPNPFFNQRDCYVTIQGNSFHVIQEGLPNGLSVFVEIKNISVFPNPNNGAFTLNIESALNQKISTNIFNSLGQLILKKQIETNTQTEFDLSANAKGIYYLQILSEEKHYYIKVSVQ